MNIAIIGPESSGKSTLGNALATALNGRYVEEYARHYIEQLRRPYNYLDVLHIARIQQSQLQERGAGFVVFDTDLIITKVWLQYKYGHCPQWIADALLPFSNPIDLYLLCPPVLPFVEDPVREHPHERQELYNIYLQEVEYTHLPYAIITGIEPQERLRQALKAVSESTLSAASCLTDCPD